MRVSRVLYSLLFLILAVVSMIFTATFFTITFLIGLTEFIFGFMLLCSLLIVFTLLFFKTLLGGN